MTEETAANAARNAFLTESVNKRVTLRLSNGEEFQGTLLRFDDSCVIINPGAFHTDMVGKPTMFERCNIIFIR